MNKSDKHQRQERDLIAYARDFGYRVIVKGDALKKDKTIWAGLGNRSGLHSYIPIAISERWNKSHKLFLKRIAEMPAGTVVEVHTFVNINRDRGRWIREAHYNMD